MRHENSKGPKKVEREDQLPGARLSDNDGAVYGSNMLQLHKRDPIGNRSSTYDFTICLGVIDLGLNRCYECISRPWSNMVNL